MVVKFNGVATGIDFGSRGTTVYNLQTKEDWQSWAELGLISRMDRLSVTKPKGGVKKRRKGKKKQSRVSNSIVASGSQP